jgi:dihydrofolate synthase/folylpolyglutamate synthase
VAGTNGKGSTCAMLEAIADCRPATARRVYTSPHLVRFEERCRIKGESSVDASKLMPQASKRSRRRGDLNLTYFEFTTLGILSLMIDEKPDVAILEVGLGGRLDAVNIIDTDCAIITSIDLDHMDYLGPDRESIGFEKAGILRAGKPAIVSDPMPPHSVLQYARRARRRPLAASAPTSTFSGDKQQWGWAGARPALQRAGLSGVARCQPAHQRGGRARRAGGGAAPVAGERAGRAQRVGHGRTAGALPDRAGPARAGARRGAQPARRGRAGGQPRRDGLLSHHPRVFGAMADKDLAPMLARIGPLIDRWYFTDLPTPRAAKGAGLLAAWQAQNTRTDASGSVHAGPMDALRAAIEHADPADRIVVFGSFFTVGGVLENGTPRLQAKHLLPGG